MQDEGIATKLSLLRTLLQQFIDHTGITIPNDFLTRISDTLSAGANSAAMDQDAAIMHGTDELQKIAAIQRHHYRLLDEAINGLQQTMAQPAIATTLGIKLNDIVAQKRKRAKLGSDLFKGTVGSSSHEAVTDIARKISDIQLDMLDLLPEAWTIMVHIGDQLS